MSSVQRRSEFSNHAAARVLPTVCSCRQQDSSEGPTLRFTSLDGALGASVGKVAAPSALFRFHKLPLHNRFFVKQGASIGANVAKLLCGLIEFSQAGVCECVRAADTRGHGAAERFHTPPLTGNHSPSLNISNISLPLLIQPIIIYLQLSHDQSIRPDNRFIPIKFEIYSKDFLL